MTLADLSIKRPVFAWMLFWGMILFGAMSFLKLGISQMPDVDFPVINIQLTMQGASPEVMETNIVDIIEDNLLSVEGVKEINSNSSYGQANIQIEFDLSRNIDAALQEVQTKVAQAQKILPTTLDPPIITKTNPEDTPIMFIAVTSTGTKRDLMVYVRDVLKSQFSTVEGVSQIYLGGFADRNLRIWIDEKKLTRLELTVEDVINAVQREHVETAGLLENSSTQKSVRSMGEVNTVQSFSKIRIPSRGGTPILEKSIFLKDVAEVEDGLEDIRRISRLNGKPAVGLGILKQRGTNAVQVAKSVKAKMNQIKAQLPPGYNMEVSFDSTLFIEESIGELEFILILSVFTTAIVCFLFLGSWSSTWNILLSIPTSIIGSFLVMEIFGFTLNTFTLLALSLAIGIVVDDAIMVLENIVRHREGGAEKVTAARKGARQITFAAIATTLSIVAIFLPVVFMKGVIGRYFFQFGVTISATVLLSLLEALTLTPMRASKYLEITSHTGKITSKIANLLHFFDKIYARVLKICLQNRLIVVSGSILVFALSVWTFFPLKKEFVPSMDQSRLFVKVQGKTGSSMAYMDEIAKKVEAVVLSEGEVLRIFSSVGGMQGGQSNLLNIFLTMKDPKDRPKNKETGKRLSQNEFAGVLRKKLQTVSPDLKISIQDLSTRGFTASRGYPVELSIQGSDWYVLAEVSEKIKSEMNSSKLFTDIDSSFQEGAPEVHVFPKRDIAANYSVNIESIGRVLEAMIGGVKVGQFTDGGHRYDIRVRLKAEDREKTEQIKNLIVRNQRGEVVPVSSVVGLEEQIVLPTITRKNRSRSISIYANPSNKIGQKEAIDLAQKIAIKLLPPGYTVNPTGSSQAMSDSFQSLYIALLLGIAVAYMILASQFNSFTLPILVLLALPFSFSGAIFALWIFNYSLNIYSFIALLLLMGLVKKNSILLVDFTNQLIEKGVPVDEAIQTASPQRLRAILMTSIATIAAAIPPALAFGPGAESRIPMAIAVIGGMLISTILTLVIVPSGYSLIMNRKR
ncbi:MAG: efflux RND transporter permease subunit [Leptospiraceae bacterium]|nr:efflux RND transporter permease subunit [Leptospiraceae bacterium]MCK6379913.1 efflux RND transporter permease subunit [Leptospiraceae bacterium]NUM40143.1 efflux RND transporter permease subunit [Leptospiraceae bacterium]